MGTAECELEFKYSTKRRVIERAAQARLTGRAAREASGHTS